MEERFDVQESIAAQAKLQKENDYPEFAPRNGVCWSCNSQIYSQIDKGKYKSGISTESAGKSLVTGCPHCHRSYCD